MLAIFCIVLASAESFGQFPPSDNPMLLKRGFAGTLSPAQTQDLPAMTSAPLGYARFTTKDWKKLIDSVWGPGLPTDSKLQIFDGFWNNVNSRYGGFPNLGLNWDSLKSVYRPEIEQGVSRGRFAGIMSHLYLSLRESHSYIYDKGIDSAFYSGTNFRPRGVPILVLSGLYWTGLGATLTPLPDSSLLVIQAHPNQPLGLKAGDIVLGYDRVPWKQLIRQLLEAQLPVGKPGTFSYWASSPESWSHILLASAAINWHLFDSLDVVKYATGDTVHLSTSKLDISDWDNFFSVEQLPVKGVPFPDATTQSYTWGIVEGTNVGYIYVRDWGINTGTLVASAIDTLTRVRKTDGLVIDFRVNMGGYAPSLTALGSLFNNDPFSSFSLANRTSTSDKMGFTIGPFGINIPAKSQFYDRPIAVLIGPECKSAGDYSAFLMRSHPMTRFFGKQTNTAYVNGSYLSGGYVANLWIYQISRGGVFSNFPGEGHLLHKGFEVDEKVWFTRDDAAKGDDTIVKRALQWMASLAYGHDAALAKIAGRSGQDTIKVTATVENSQKHTISVWSYLADRSGVLSDSAQMFDDGLHNDGVAGDKVYGGSIRPPAKENMFGVSIRTVDFTTGTFRHLLNARRYFTSGPVIGKGWVSATSDTIPNPGDVMSVKFKIANSGKSDTVRNVLVSASALDTTIVVATGVKLAYGDLLPGQESVGTATQSFTVRGNCPPNAKARILLTVVSEGFAAWTDTVTIQVQAAVTEVAFNSAVPLEYSLSQNYPNPFNPATKIEFSIAKSGLVSLKVYDLLGREMATLVNEVKAPGTYTLRWDAGSMQSGVYFYRLTAGDFSKSRKLILLR
jgi:hypothetical protein